MNCNGGLREKELGIRRLEIGFGILEIDAFAARTHPLAARTHPLAARTVMFLVVRGANNACAARTERDRASRGANM